MTPFGGLLLFDNGRAELREYLIVGHHEISRNSL
jgi:hypothetical protein